MKRPPRSTTAPLQVRRGVRAPVFPRTAFRELEAALSDPLFLGIPAGRDTQ